MHINFGREFSNQVFEEYAAKENIKWESSALYTSMPNKKAKHLNYILMSLVHSILIAMYQSKIMWDKLTKTVIYFKN